MFGIAQYPIVACRAMGECIRVTVGLIGCLDCSSAFFRRRMYGDFLGVLL